MSDIGGLDDSIATNKRKRKRRKVVIDNDKTELTSEEIKRNLSDTSKIIGEKFNPSTAINDDFLNDDDEEEGEGRRGVRDMSWEER